MEDSFSLLKTLDVSWVWERRVRVPGYRGAKLQIIIIKKIKTLQNFHGVWLRSDIENS